MKEVADSLGIPYPRVLIVGDANEGGEPEKNQVDLGYFIDPTGACYFDPDPYWCPTEDEAADFDHDGLADMQLARLPVTSATKIALAVQNFLNKVGSEPTHRALFTLGDLARAGISPQGLPELMSDLINAFKTHGYQILYMKDSDYPYYNWETRQLDMADSLSLGVDIVINTGAVSNRSKIGGYFIQKVSDPPWDMDWLTDIGPRPFVFFGPGCDMADFDRDNPVYDPILAEMFLCNEPTKPAAVAWISHGRGNWSSWHRLFAREFTAWLFSGEARDLLDCFWLTKRSCWQQYPEMRNYLKSLFYLGWPVSIPGTCSAGTKPPTTPQKLALLINPNPANSAVTLKFAVPRKQKVNLKIYDVTGRLVSQLLDETLQAGWHTFIWTQRDSHGSRVAPGVYFAHLATPNQTATRKIIILR